MALPATAAWGASLPVGSYPQYPVAPQPVPTAAPWGLQDAYQQAAPTTYDAQALPQLTWLQQQFQAIKAQIGALLDLAPPSYATPPAYPPVAYPPVGYPPVGYPPVAYPPVAYPPVAYPPVAYPPVGFPPVAPPPPPLPPAPVPPPPPAPPAPAPVHQAPAHRHPAKPHKTHKTHKHHHHKLHKPHVLSMPSPNFNDRPPHTKIDTIILHHTATSGTAQDTGRFFHNPAVQVSSHYVVGKDGTIVQCVPDGKRAWHAGASDFHGREDVNDFSLGIEIVNRGDNHDPYPQQQYEALANLVAWMMQKYHVPMDRITGHRNVSHEGKVDPSNNFNWAKLKRMVNHKLGR